MKNFISSNSPFLITDTRLKRWAIPYHHECVNARINVLLDNNQKFIKDKSILDIGSHTGIFSFAALQLGANFIHGIDAEKITIERCKNLFSNEDLSSSKYKFEVENIINFLENVEENAYDTIFCFGVMYYMTEPYRLLSLMARAARESILIDTFTAAYAALQGRDAAKTHPHLTDHILNLPLMITCPTQSKKKDYYLPESFSRKGHNLSLTNLPTQAMLELWFESLNLSWKPLNWSDYIIRDCSFRDLLTHEQKLASHWADIYSSGIRVSYRIEPK